MAAPSPIRQTAEAEAESALQSLRAYSECGAKPFVNYTYADSDLTGQAGAMLGILATFVENDGKDWNRELLAQAIRGAETLIWFDRFIKEAAEGAKA